MTRQEGTLLFSAMHPGFFENESIKSMPDDWVFDEMALTLDEFDPQRYDRKLGSDVSFGVYQGALSAIKKAVEQVDEDWPQYFTGRERIYCGYVDGAIASFCTIADLGVHEVGGRRVKIGGPGCVGTLPEYRDRGIGITMVKHVTQILKDEGYDVSYIHYTSVAPWYGKLGYETTVRWTGKGILE